MTSDQGVNQSNKITVKVDSDFASLIPKFIEEWKSDVLFMKKALEESDYASIYRLGHDMKGTGGACGFQCITDLGADLEKAAKAKDPGVILINLNALLSYLKRVDVLYI